MAIKESDIKALMKTVMSATMQTVSAGRQTVISPTEVKNITRDILAQFESGSVVKFEQAMDRTERIVEKLGVNIKDFNTGLAKRIEELKNQRDKSAKEVELLRADNIAAETKTIKTGKEFRVETRILTNSEIEMRKSLLKQRKEQFEEEEEKVIKKREKILEEEKVLSPQMKQQIIDDKDNIDKQRELIEKEDATLNPLDPPGEREGQSSQFLDELKAPFVAFGDALTGLKEGAMQVTGIFKFFKRKGCYYWTHSYSR